MVADSYFSHLKYNYLLAAATHIQEVDQSTFQTSFNLDIGTTATANESHIPVKPRKAGV